MKSVALIFLIFFSSTAYQQVTAAPESVDNNIEQFFDLFKERKYEQATQLIAYPKSYSQNEVISDYNSITRNFKSLDQLVGSLTGYHKTNTYPDFYEFGVSAGKEMYWWTKEGAKTSVYYYTGSFSKGDTLILKVLTANYGKSEEIGMLYFGFLTSDEHSKENITHLYHKILDDQGIPKNHPIREQIIQNLPVLSGNE
ncbi:MAG: hypothetical protein KDJ38_10145 [Gammaproteobacteria bacterium]|nr:hypothetical protein [Gammaproteobacteria bacterium]